MALDLILMKPTRCTLLLSTFTSTSLRISGQLCAHHQENLLYLCDTGVFHSVWVAVSRVGEERGVYRLLVGKPEGKRPLGRPRRRWVDNIRTDL